MIQGAPPTAKTRAIAPGRARSLDSSVTRAVGERLVSVSASPLRDVLAGIAPAEMGAGR
jgi:hypothetical protein